MGRKPFGMRWIDCNKGEEQRPELLSRLVVQETRQTSTISVSDIDARQAFEFAVCDHLLNHDFKQGMFSTCVFALRSKHLLYFVDGDDYVGLGVRGDLEGYKAKLSERFIIKDRGILGADGLHEIRILNRVITYHPAKPGCPEMLTFEADQKHADLLMAA